MEGGRLQVKLGDFGLARQVYCDDTPMTPHPGVSETNYYTGSVGTQLYAAPEQLNGSNYDHKVTSLMGPVSVSRPYTLYVSWRDILQLW